MLKIFPIIIIPLFFFIIFLGVKNLTQNNSNIVEVVQEKVDNEKEQISAKTDKKLANVEELKEPIEKKKAIIIQPKNNELEKLEDTKINSNKTDLKKKKEKVIKKEKEPNLSKTNQVVLQFGAFSRKDYAQNQKKDIEQKIKNKFPEIKINVDFESDRKLYKLIYKAKDKSLAKSICKFSEKIKINCLIKNK
tara:strand:- start:231 stop:806 length:576 start_codon:yes stop_codon:yes gene_type:complete